MITQKNKFRESKIPNAIKNILLFIINENLSKEKLSLERYYKRNPLRSLENVDKDSYFCGKYDWYKRGRKEGYLKALRTLKKRLEKKSRS